MSIPRRPPRDPRTVAREIPGLLDAIFPQLTPGIVMHINQRAFSISKCATISQEGIDSSSLQNAMLFEVALAAGEQLLAGAEEPNWNEALELALRRQRRHFDAVLPKALTAKDIEIASSVANNLSTMLQLLAIRAGGIVCSPSVPGFQWVASGNGDFAIDSTLVEVKCTNRPFSSSDYRQVLMYWLLSFASSVESGTHEWSEALLLNPRLNKVVRIEFKELVALAGAGRSKVEILEIFRTMIGDSERLLSRH